jgi:aminoglycoside 2'-N-acetyltransferase I
VVAVEQFETRDAAPGQLRAIRQLLDDAFAGDFSDDDWHHTLGGRHVVVTLDGQVLSHAAVVARVLDVDGRPLRAGYVEGVATAPHERHRGLGSLVMDGMATTLRESYELGGLSTSAHGFYERLGWERWQGPSYVRDGDDRVRTEDEDAGIMVLRFGPSAGIDLTAAITCEARAGDDW